MYWPWKVDPLTRKPAVNKADIAEIVSWLDRADEVVFQNAKYDIQALVSVGLKWKERWWDKIHDTLLSCHLLASGLQSKDLTTQAISFLGIDIKPFEEKVQQVINECRKIVRLRFPNWFICESVKDKEPPPGLPSLKGEDGLWKWDMWLGEALADALKLPAEHDYRTALPNYALTDSSVTLPLWEEHKRLMEERELRSIYNIRRKLIRIIYEMESKGVTYSASRLEELMSRFTAESSQAERVALTVAKSKGWDVKFPKSGSNGSLQAIAEAKNGLDFPGLLKELDPSFADGATVPSGKSKSGFRTPGGKLSLKAVTRDTVQQILENKEPNSWRHQFVKNWSAKTKRDTACTYGRSYKRFGIPLKDGDSVLIHSSMNATGTSHLRMSSERPNQQNVSKQGDVNLRYAFGPTEGREWWSADYENIELRIPAYVAEERAMIDLFERPDDAPYYGSQHLLIAHVLWPKEFEQCLKEGVGFKDKYKATLYQWIKNGNFATQFGAMEESGTADRAYHQQGAQAKVKSRFKRIAKLNEEKIALAERQGFVTTLPDREIGIGYPLQIPRGKWGKVTPTCCLNYFVSGSAMWCTCKAMIRCSEYLREVSQQKRKQYYITLQVHDELDLDFPVGKTPDENLPIALECKRLMEESGPDIGIPLKVDLSYHPSNWAEKIDVEEVLNAAA